MLNLRENSHKNDFNFTHMRDVGKKVEMNFYRANCLFENIRNVSMCVDSEKRKKMLKIILIFHGAEGILM